MLKVQTHMRGLAAALPEQILTSTDYTQALTWVPGHFGAAANHPWSIYLTFGQYSVGSEPRSELQKVLPPAFQGPVASRTRRAAVLKAEGAGDATFVLRSDIDNTWRERCE